MARNPDRISPMTTREPLGPMVSSPGRMGVGGLGGAGGHPGHGVGPDAVLGPEHREHGGRAVGPVDALHLRSPPRGW